MRHIYLTMIGLLATMSIGAQEHEYVDLGLPSGTKWATMNIGADSVRGIGAFFSYGDVTPDYITPGKTTDYERSFDWSHYKWCEGQSDRLTKYCSNPTYGYQGFTDNLTTLLPEDDAATTLWGENWRTPTTDEYIELEQNCQCDMVTENGVMGMRITSKVPGFEDRSIFLPYVGERDSARWKTYDDGIVSCYQTATSSNTFCDIFAFPDQQGIFIHIITRDEGCNVRAVYNEPQPQHTAVDLGLGVLWSVSNLGTMSFDGSGKYYTWGDTLKITERATWDNYIYGTENALTKYNTKPECGIVDNKTQLDAHDDIATYQWGEGWHMPDTTDWKELAEQCDWQWTTIGEDVHGFLITSKVSGYEGKKIFLPTSGFVEDDRIYNFSTEFYYYTARLDQDNPNKAISIFFSDQDPLTIRSDFRYYGFACRPVKDKQEPTSCRAIRQNTTPATKYLTRGGAIMIRRNGVDYTLMGCPR